MSRGGKATRVIPRDSDLKKKSRAGLGEILASHNRKRLKPAEQMLGRDVRGSART